MGAEDPQLSAASIVKIEKPDEEEPFIPYITDGGHVSHGAAVTIHKAQGSQWDTVQVFAPDIYTAARGVGPRQAHRFETAMLRSLVRGNA